MRKRLSLLVALLLLLLPNLALAAGAPSGRVAYIWRERLWTYDLASGERRMLPESGELSTPQWSPSGTYLTVRRGKQSLILATDGSLRRPLPRTDGDPAWAPNADRLATWARGGKLQVESPQGEVLQAIPIKREPHYESPLWRPDGTQLAWVEGNGGQTARLQIASVSTGKPRQLYSTSGESGHACLYLAGWQAPRSALLPRRSRGSILLWPQPTCSASIAADGEALAAVSVTSGAFRLLQTPTGPLITLHHPAAIARGGRAAITAGSNRISTQTKQIVVIEPDGQVSSPVSPTEQAAIQPAWAPDGRRLAWSGAPDYGPDQDWRKGLRERRIWVAPLQGKPIPVTADPAYADEAPVWTADAQHLLFARLDAQEQASLWLLDLSTSHATKVADVDVGPTRDYYGWREWGRVFAYSPR